MNTPHDDNEWSGLLKQLEEENDCERIWQMLLSAPPIWARRFALALVELDWTPINFAQRRLHREIVSLAKKIEEKGDSPEAPSNYQAQKEKRKQLHDGGDSLSIIRASCDGRFLFEYCPPGQIDAKDLDTLTVLDTVDAEVNGSEARILALDVSPDGSHIAAHLGCTTTSLEALKVWKFNGTKFALRFEQKWHGKREDRLPPEASLYLMKLTVKLMNLSQTDNIRRDLPHYLRSFAVRMSYLRFSSDGKMLAHLRAPYQVVLWNVRLGSRINIYNPRPDKPDKEANVAVSRATSVLYKVVNGPSEYARNAGIPDYVNRYTEPPSVAYRPYSSAKNQSSGGKQDDLPPEAYNLWSAPWDTSCSPIAFSGNNRLMALCDAKEVLIMSVPAFKLRAQIPINKPRAVLLNQDASLAVIVDDAGQLIAHNLKDDASHLLDEGANYDASLVMSPDWQCFAFRDSGSITIYASSSHTKIKELTTSLGHVASLQFLRDGSLLNIDAGGAVEKHTPAVLGEKVSALIHNSINELTMEQYNEIWSLHLTSWCNKDEKLWLELTLLLLRNRLIPATETEFTEPQEADKTAVDAISKETDDSQ